MALLFKSDIDRGDAWREAFRVLAPELEVREWPDVGDPEEIDYALVWRPPKGELASYPNLKVIFSVGAGIDHLASDPDLPKGVPVVRMVEPGLTAGMTEFVVMNVLFHHRFMLDSWPSSGPRSGAKSNRYRPASAGSGSWAWGCSAGMRPER